jgi:hypothetical protein
MVDKLPDDRFDVPTLTDELPYIQFNGKSVLSLCNRSKTPHFAELRELLRQNHGFTRLVLDSDEPHNLVDLTVPDHWWKFSKQCPSSMATKQHYTRRGVDILVSFGPYKGTAHIEWGGMNGWAYLEHGRKKWEFWRPGRRPLAGALPHLTINQEAGECMWLPAAWWHRVTTGVNGGLLIGTNTVSRQSVCELPVSRNYYSTHTHDNVWLRDVGIVNGYVAKARLVGGHTRRSADGRKRKGGRGRRFVSAKQNKGNQKRLGSTK